LRKMFTAVGYHPSSGLPPDGLEPLPFIESGPSGRVQKKKHTDRILLGRPWRRIWKGMILNGLKVVLQCATDGRSSAALGVTELQGSQQKAIESPKSFGDSSIVWNRRPFTVLCRSPKLGLNDAATERFRRYLFAHSSTMPSSVRTTEIESTYDALRKQTQRCSTSSTVAYECHRRKTLAHRGLIACFGADVTRQTVRMAGCNILG